MIIQEAPLAAKLTSATGGVFQASAGGNLILNAPGTNKLNGQRFKLVASGTATSGPGTFTATVQPILYGDASLATVTTKPLFSATAGTLAYTGTASATIPWTLEAVIEGDSASATFGGYADSNVGTTFKVPTVLVAPVSSINFATEPPIKFALGITVGGTVGASTAFTVSEFYLAAE